MRFSLTRLTDIVHRLACAATLRTFPEGREHPESVEPCAVMTLAPTAAGDAAVALVGNREPFLDTAVDRGDFPAESPRRKYAAQPRGTGLRSATTAVSGRPTWLAAGDRANLVPQHPQHPCGGPALQVEPTAPMPRLHLAVVESGVETLPAPGPRRPSPVPRTTLRSFHTPYRREVLERSLQIPRRLPRPAPRGDRRSTSTAASRPTPRAPPPRTPASLRTGVAPADCPGHVARFTSDLLPVRCLGLLDVRPDSPVGDRGRSQPRLPAWTLFSPRPGSSRELRENRWARLSPW